MRSKILCAGWCLVVALGALGEHALVPGELVLARRGAPAEYAVVLPAAASESQRYASEELVKYVEMTTGVRLPVVTEREARPEKGIYLGGEAADLGEEGFRLKTKGPNLRICGSAVRGTLYGVYELLERFAGCRWYASWCTIAPPRGTIAVPSDLDETQRPAFPCREPHWWDMFKPDFATHCRANGASMRLQARHGGATWRFGGGLGNCHTFSRLVPASVYGKEHPEYFALHGGERRNDPKTSEDFNVQPCLTHPDVLRIVTSNVLACIRRDPTARFYGVSQNDNMLYCECPSCAAVDAEEESHAGTVVRFVNAVAEAVEREFPDKYIETLAYQYSRVPPRKTRLRRNVIPCFCSIECEFSRPMTTSLCPANRQLLADIVGWERQTDQLYVWDYCTDFAHYPHLFPNVYALQDNVRFFRDHHVKTLFEQGACQGRHAGFAELKAWLLAKWMWNPDLPIQPLLDDFFAGYYGAAAPHVRRVFEQAHALQLAAASEGRFLKIYEDPNASPLTDAFLEESAMEMAAAERAVKDDPLRSYNVRMTSFGVDYMRAERLRRGARLVDFVRGAALDEERTRLRKLVRSLLARMDEAKDIRLGSGDVKGRHARLLEAWRRVEAGADAPCAVARDQDGRRSVLVEDAHLNILKEGVWANRVADPRADDGKAIEITNVHYGWCVTLPFTHVAFRPERKYRCEARLRVVPAADARPEAQAFSAGVYDNGLKKGRCGVHRKLGEIPDGEYAWYDLGEWKPGDTADKQYFWAASGYFNKQEPGAHSAVKAVYLDAIRLSE